MRLTLRQLQIFAAVAECGSTRSASASVAMSQSAASTAINELERALDSRLFDRIGKRLVLNESGRALLPQAHTMLDAANDIETQFGIGTTRRAGSAVAIRLRVGASTTVGNYVLPPIIAAYRAEAPRSLIDVRIGNTSQVAQAVAQMQVDFGLIEGPCHEPDLVAHPWLTDELVIVCAPDYPLARDRSRGRIPISALRTERWLLREPGSGTREAVEQVLLPHLHHLHSELQFGGTEAIKQATAAGLGITCLSARAVRDLVALGRLIVLDTALKRLERRFYMIHHRQKQFSQGLHAFLTHCDPSRIESS